VLKARFLNGNPSPAMFLIRNGLLDSVRFPNLYSELCLLFTQHYDIVSFITTLGPVSDACCGSVWSNCHKFLGETSLDFSWGSYICKKNTKFPAYASAIYYV